MLSLIPLPWRLIVVVLVIAAAIVAITLYVEGERSEARHAGALAERAIWIEAKRVADAEAEADRQAAQEKIDQAERERLAAEARNVIALADLNEIIARQEADNATNTNPGGGDVCRVSDPVGRELRNALDAIGRGHR